ncbi:TonB-dependent receptor domain-containing protein [Microscilla marina]|uniref:TonB-dependent receptor domain protein n=1 Tax=Microscilla marina ATCC 23134 TaxID=313606 RepID=A1ZC46_MICM2|nr:TonB-dependent receptor [Microscilla marina]EAY31848.1 TonB-dependent receptor domain protein [Microscilla marina ATCC 23134]
MEYNQSRNAYVTLNSTVHRLKTYASYWWGRDGTFSLLAPYNYRVLDATTEYDFQPIKNLTLTPSVAVRFVDYKEDLSTGKDQLLEDNATSFTYAGGVKLDYQLAKKWRIIGGIRAEKFKFPNQIYLNYQAILAYKPGEKHFFRLLYGRANTGSFLYNNKVNISVTPPIAPPPGFDGFKVTNQGVPDVEPITQDMIELGYRGKLNNRILWNVEVFASSTTNFTTSVSNGPQPNPPFIEEILRRTNIPLRVEQVGTTLSMNLSFSRLKITPFITLQQTNLKNFSPSNRSPSYDSTQSYLDTYDLPHEGTPAFYGGLNVFYLPISGLQIYLNAFVFGSHNFYGSVMAPPGAPLNLADASKAVIPQQALINIKVNYALKDQIHLFVNARNLLSNKQPQHFHTDRIRPMVLFGFGVDL